MLLLMEGQFFQIIFIILIGILIVIAIRNPKDVFLTVPRILLNKPINFLKFIAFIIIAPITFLSEKLKYEHSDKLRKTINFIWKNEDQSEDKPLPHKEIKKVDFEEGKKFLAINSSKDEVLNSINEYLEFTVTKFKINDFIIKEFNPVCWIECPVEISFPDFHFLVQHIYNKHGDRQSYGFYESDRLDFTVYQDNETSNNLLGFTDKNKSFSIYLLDESLEECNLFMNPELKTKKKWIDDIKKHVC